MELYFTEAHAKHAKAAWGNNSMVYFVQGYLLGGFIKEDATSIEEKSRALTLYSGMSRQDLPPVAQPAIAC